MRRESQIRLGNFLFRTRSYWPTGVLVVGLVLTYFDSSSDIIPVYISYFLCLSGVLVRFIAVGFSAPDTSGRNTTQGQIAASLNTTGMYACCRHPLYFGNFLLWVGVSSLTQNLWFLLIVLLSFFLYYGLIIQAEEAFLTEKFEEEFLDWREQTSAFFPKLWRWKKPMTSLQWHKILFGEKSTILNLVVALFLMNKADRLGGEAHFILYDPLNFLLAGILTFYLVLKGIEKGRNLH